MPDQYSGILDLINGTAPAPLVPEATDIAVTPEEAESAGVPQDPVSGLDLLGAEPVPPSGIIDEPEPDEPLAAPTPGLMPGR